MNKKSLVKYIGGQDKIGKKNFQLKTNEVYTVKELCNAKFGGVSKKGVILEEAPDKVFVRSLFIEAQSPMTIDINEICGISDIVTQSKYSILDYLN